MSAPTLFEALQTILDLRTKKGRRFPLATTLVIALAAMLSGADDLLAVARWGRRLSPKAQHALGASKKRRKAGRAPGRGVRTVSPAAIPAA